MLLLPVRVIRCRCWRISCTFSNTSSSIMRSWALGKIACFSMGLSLCFLSQIGVSLEVHRAACVLPAFQNRHNGTAAVHPDAGRICNTASEAASAAILYRNTDRADGFACHPHRRDAFRLRRNTGHRLKAPQEQLSVASVLGVGCCVLCPAGGIGLRRPYYSTKPVPVKLIRALLCSASIRLP